MEQNATGKQSNESSTSSQYKRDTQLGLLSDKSTGYWLKRLAVSREHEHSFQAFVGTNEIAFLATYNILDESKIPQPIRWQLTRIRGVDNPNLFITPSQTERAELSKLLIEFGSNLNPVGRLVEVSFA